MCDRKFQDLDDLLRHKKTMHEDSVQIFVWMCFGQFQFHSYINVKFAA